MRALIITIFGPVIFYLILIFAVFLTTIVESLFGNTPLIQGIIIGISTIFAMIFTGYFVSGSLLQGIISALINAIFINFVHIYGWYEIGANLDYSSITKSAVVVLCFLLGAIIGARVKSNKKRNKVFIN